MFLQIIKIYLFLFLVLLQAKSCMSYLATVELQLESFRTLNPRTISENDWCDHRGGGDCDFVFYVNNCSRLDGVNYECTERIKRFYGPSNTNTFKFADGKPSTAFLIDRFPRELVVNITVWDEDEGWSKDDFVGNYIIKFDPNIISGQQTGIPPLQQHIITIPDHSELTVKYRAYCNDKQCRDATTSAPGQQNQQSPYARVSRSTVFPAGQLSVDPRGTYLIIDDNSQFPKPPPFSYGYAVKPYMQDPKEKSVKLIQFPRGNDAIQTSFNRHLNNSQSTIGHTSNLLQKNLKRELSVVKSDLNHGSKDFETNAKRGLNDIGLISHRTINSVPLPKINHNDITQIHYPAGYLAGSIPIRSHNSIMQNFNHLIPPPSSLNSLNFNADKTPLIRALGASGKKASKVIRAARVIGDEPEIHFSKVIRVLSNREQDMQQVYVNDNRNNRHAEIVVAKNK